MRFDVESWIWYVLAVGIIIARLVSRSLLFRSIKRLQWDDWIMGILVTACYTTLIVMANIEARSQSNLLPPGFDISTLTDDQIAKREHGSKIVIVVEQMQIAVIWACKSCLLILYHRLTHMVAIKENIAIRLLAVYLAVGFVVMEVLYFTAWCRPFSEYWAVPTSNPQCNALIHHRITNAVFNVSSDIIMLCIALPMFIRSLLPLKRKLILCCIFSLGIFAILAAVLNKYYSFTVPYQPTWIFWYVRESSTAILVANLPFTWTLLRKVFNLGAFDESRPPPPTYHSARTAGGRTQRKRDSGHGPGQEVKNSVVHHQGGHGSHASHVSHVSHVSHANQRRSLIGSMCVGGNDKHHTAMTNNSDNSENSENGLLGRQDYRRHSHHGEGDLEMGEAHFAPIHARPVSANFSGPSSTRISYDPYQARHHPQLLVPQTAHHATSSRRSSVASGGRGPAWSHMGSEIAHPVSTGGGRSAGDRRMRSRMSP